MNLAVSNPNFSIVVPGGCNARCRFCFWKQTDRNVSPLYFSALSKTLANLPGAFRECSITGGEPTASDLLPTILEMARARFAKVVLSSNGFRLRDEVFSRIDHLNISRHHWADTKNRERFGTVTVPGAAALQAMCRRANAAGVDVTLNCVVAPGFADSGFVYDYIDFAKQMGANAVCFRKEHGDLEDLPVEKWLHSRVIREGGCPACRTKVRLIAGMPVTWRYGLLEPTEVMTGVYELVFQQDGRLTADWAGKKPVRLTTPRDVAAAKAEAPFQGCSHGGMPPVVGGKC